MVTDVDCVVKGILHSPPSSNNEGKNPPPQKKKDVSFRHAFCFLYALSRLLFYFEIVFILKGLVDVVRWLKTN
jgi:hypothetical protein